MRSSTEEAYISDVSCRCLARSSNSVGTLSSAHRREANFRNQRMPRNWLQEFWDPFFIVRFFSREPLDEAFAKNVIARLLRGVDRHMKTTGAGLA